MASAKSEKFTCTMFIEILRVSEVISILSGWAASAKTEE